MNDIFQKCFADLIGSVFVAPMRIFFNIIWIDILEGDCTPKIGKGSIYKKWKNIGDFFSLDFLVQVSDFGTTITLQKWFQKSSIVHAHISVSVFNSVCPLRFLNHRPFFVQKLTFWPHRHQYYAGFFVKKPCILLQFSSGYLVGWNFIFFSNTKRIGSLVSSIGMVCYGANCKIKKVH